MFYTSESIRNKPVAESVWWSILEFQNECGNIIPGCGKLFCCFDNFFSKLLIFQLICDFPQIIQKWFSVKWGINRHVIQSFLWCFKEFLQFRQLSECRLIHLILNHSQHMPLLVSGSVVCISVQLCCVVQESSHCFDFIAVAVFRNSIIEFLQFILKFKRTEWDDNRRISKFLISILHQ